jgi:PilZ domain
MGQIQNLARATHSQRRKYRRFNLRYPVRVEFLSGGTVREVETVSRNISMGGLLLDSTSLLPKSHPLSFTLTIQGGSVVRPIKFLGEGRVVRVEHHGRGTDFSIAVECAQPLTQMEDYLSGSAN